MGKDFGNKYILQTGNFSYSGYDEYGKTELEKVMNSFWGWRELEITETSATSYYLIVESEATIVGRVRQVPRQEINRISFFLTY